MKKLISLSLALLLCIALSVPAFAAEGLDALVLDGPSDYTFVEKKIDYIYGNTYQEGYYEENSFEGWRVIAPGSKFMVANNSTDSTAYVYVCYEEVKLMPNGSTVKWLSGEDLMTETMIDVSGKYAAYDVWNLSTAPDMYMGGLSAGGGLYWVNSPAAGLNMNTDSAMILSAGEKASFELPQQGDKNSIYRLYAHIYYPQDDLDYWMYYNYKIGDVTPSVPETPSAPAFSDVAAKDWFADSVRWAIEKGITNGTSSTTFSPNDTCTQEQIITFLYRANGTPATSISNPYADVTANAWYYDAVRWGYQNGLRKDASFGVAKPCSRSDVVFYLWTLAGKPAPTKAAVFTDVPDGASYAQAVAWAVEKGITTGTGAAAFSPNDTCTRAQIVTFLYRAYK